MASITEFLRLVSAELGVRAEHPVAVAGAEQLAARLAHDPTPLDCEASFIPALESLQALPPHPLTHALRQVSNEFPWMPAPRVGDDGSSAGLALLSDCVDLGPLNVGLMLVGPNGGYPEHHHPPPEVYLILGGEAHWRYGGSTGFRLRTVGDVVHNHPNDLHEVRTSSLPTVAVWVLYDGA